MDVPTPSPAAAATDAQPAVLTAASPRVVVVSAEPAWPVTSGGRIAVHHMVCGMRDAGLDVTLVCLADSAEPPVHDLGYLVEWVPVEEGSTLRVAAQGLRRAAARQFDQTAMWRSTDLRRRCQAAVERLEPDVVVFNHTYFSWDPGVAYLTVAQNVETERMRRANHGRIPLSGQLLARRERRTVRSGGGYACFSEDDRRRLEQLGAAAPISVVPIGVDPATEPRAAQPRKVRRVGYLGSLDYEPNREAVDLLVAQSESLLGAGVEEVVVAGRAAARWLPHIDSPGVTVIGEVDDAYEFLGSLDALVVPLINGGGIRVKVLEAFAMGIPVVCTPVGCEGLPVTDDVELVITAPDRLADGVRRLGGPARRQKRADAAFALWQSRYTPAAAGSAVTDAVLAALSAPGRGGAPAVTLERPELRSEWCLIHGDDTSASQGSAASERQVFDTGCLSPTGPVRVRVEFDAPALQYSPRQIGVAVAGTVANTEAVTRDGISVVHGFADPPAGVPLTIALRFPPTSDGSSPVPLRLSVRTSPPPLLARTAVFARAKLESVLGRSTHHST